MSRSYKYILISLIGISILLLLMIVSKSSLMQSRPQKTPSQLKTTGQIENQNIQSIKEIPTNETSVIQQQEKVVTNPPPVIAPNPSREKTSQKLTSQEDSYLAHSTFTFATVTIPMNIDAMDISYEPIKWAEDAAFIVVVDDHTIYSMPATYFRKELMTTGLMDLSPWTGKTVLLSFGLMSKSPGSQISVKQAKLYNSRGTTTPAVR